MQEFTGDRGRSRGRGRGAHLNRPREPKPGTVGAISSRAPLREPAPQIVTALSPYADEFVPSAKSSSSSSTISTQSDHSRTARISLEQISQSSKRFKERQATNATDISVLQNLEEIVCILGTYRETFDDVIEPLVRTLKSWVVDERSMEYVVERLLDEAVCNPNFRYIGVRMCDHLDRHLQVKGHGKTIRFRSILLNKCKNEHKEFQQVEKQQADRGRWFGFCLFIGEVYRQIQLQDEPLNVIGRACMDHIEWLLKDGQPDALFMAFSLFKLTGPALDVTPELKDRISAVILDMQGRLKDLGTVLAVHRQVQEVGNRTLKLRATNWNFNAQIAQSSSTSHALTQPAQNALPAQQPVRQTSKAKPLPSVEGNAFMPKSSTTQPLAAEAVAINEPALGYDGVEQFTDWAQYYEGGGLLFQVVFVCVRGSNWLCL